jgi:PAS domain S-box-containing protein
MTNSELIPILAAAVVQSALGLTVFFANPRRKSNQCLLLLSFLALGWLATLYYGFAATKLTTATACMREAFAAGALVLAGFNLLRLSIRYQTQNWSGILRRSRFWLVATAGIIGFCQTRFFLEGARLPSGIGNAAPQPIYGPAAPIYAAYFAVAIAILIISAARDLKQTKGGQRTELAFILVGGVATLAVSLLLSIALRFFVDPLRLLWFAPFRVVLFSAIVAYGIATRKIMEVGVLFRRLISYGLLSTYLLALYILVWWLAATALRSSVSNAHTIAHVTAAIVVAFAMAPARGISQRLAERLFIGSHQLDFRATVSKAAKILASVTTLRDLLDRFAHTVAEAVGTDRVFILLQDKQGFSQQYPMADIGSRQRLELTSDQATIVELGSNREPIVMDELHRARPTPQLQRVMRQLDSLQIALAMGIFARDQLAGVLLLGPRRSGRIYGSVEQSALQVLCGQLAVAIENAELFTEVQNAKIYNETLLENLTSGVIAAGTDERITVFNNEAGLITGLNSEAMLDRSLDNLPNQLGAPLRETLRTGKSQESGEISLRVGNNDLIVRTSTQIFHGEDGEMLGALMVLTDITAIKRLELQIRRSDRLASLGTLSAGMAHEIKNPLVSIKTFAQLLPERYQDSDFRETFSNLIGHEIDRIDSLVNQLLRFARPTKPILKQLHAHEVLEKSLLLIGHRLYQKEIKLTRSWEADVDTIRADADQLEQVFLNFFLNAIDAMKNGGELIVGTQIRNEETWLSSISQSNGEAREALRITIRDNGEGIRSEDIPHVFDPFFSTKDYGTGLGLSVVHGIIQEHGGQVEVESELKKGTAFHILLPLVRFESQVVVA